MTSISKDSVTSGRHSMLRKTLYNLPQSQPYLLVTLMGWLIFLPTWLRLFEQWLKWEQVLAHGLPTFLLFLGLILFHPPTSPTRENSGWPILGSLATVAVVLCWAIFELVNIDTLTYLILPAGIGALSWAFLGFRATLNFIPYLLLLSLSLPFWGDFIGPLVSLASIVVGKLVSLIGMTAFIEGNSITLPYGRLVIADGCSGIRYFAISILLAATISILNDYRWRGWGVSLAVAVALGLISNWVRITGLVIVGYTTEMQSGLMTSHELYGWIIYALLCLPALFFAPVQNRGHSHFQTAARINPKGVVALALGILVGPALVWLAQGNYQARPMLELASVETRPSLTGTLPLPLALPDTLSQARLRVENSPVQVSLAQYQRSSSDEKLVPYLREPIDRELWRNNPNIQIDQNLEGRPLRVYRNVINQRQVVISQWYRIGPFETESYSIAKLLQIPSTLLNDNRFALITAQAACSTFSCETEINELKKVAEAIELNAPE